LGEGAFDRTLRQMYTRVGLEGLCPHLEATYGIAVADVSAIGVGPGDPAALRVDRKDGPPWVARVFPAGRPAEAAAGDAAVLRHAEAHGFPAERLATDAPLSELHGQSVLVTGFIPSAPPRRAGPLPGGLGGFQARLHSLPLPSGRARRPAGALHHFAEGTRADEVAAVKTWLDQIEPRVPTPDRRHVHRLRAALDESDAGEGLPEAFIHPDPVPVNMVGTEDGPCLVDWTGAGVGPRAVALEYVRVLPFRTGASRSTRSRHRSVKRLSLSTAAT
jgi:hypothetical protein